MQTDQLLAGVAVLSVLGLLIAWGLARARAFRAAEVALDHGVNNQDAATTVLTDLPASLPLAAAPGLQA